MKKSLSQLKRDAKAGVLKMELIERYGQTGDEIPERLRGVRPVIGANTTCIFFRNANGSKSDLPISRAALVDYDDDTLTVYCFGEREMTPEEKAVMDAWKQIADSDEYKARARVDILSDGSSTFYQKKWFFEKRGFPWMTGWESLAKYGKSYNPNTGLVKDVNVRGDVQLKYRIVH